MENMLGEVHHNDLLTLCGRLPDHSIDMILCDLPYGTTACSWDTVIPFDPMWEQFHRVAKTHAAIVLFSSQPFSALLIASNIKRYVSEWVWDKHIPSGMFYARYQQMRQHENIHVFASQTAVYYPQMVKREQSIKGGGMSDTATSDARGWQALKKTYTHKQPVSIIKFDKIRKGSHPTQKPVALCEYLIKTYTQPGELVFDPCCGSGTTGIAALNTGRKYILGDIGKEWVDVSRKRINAHDPTQHTVLSNGQKQLSLFANKIGDEG